MIKLYKDGEKWILSYPSSNNVINELSFSSVELAKAKIIEMNLPLHFPDNGDNNVSF